MVATIDVDRPAGDEGGIVGGEKEDRPQQIIGGSSRISAEPRALRSVRRARHDTLGRAYSRRKLAAGKTPMEAMRCMHTSSAAGLTPHAGTSDQSQPDEGSRPDEENGMDLVLVSSWPYVAVSTFCPDPAAVAPQSLKVRSQWLDSRQCRRGVTCWR